MESEMAVASEIDRPLTAMGVVSRVRLIQEVMQHVMKKDTHYGTIPGCGKPSLWKPGAEQLLVTFKIEPGAPKVEDLGVGGGIRYRVTRTGFASGRPVASGIGECSSDEEKYRWRSPVCQAEYDATPEDMRRMKFKRDGSSYPQVRTNPADLANTILKMADKRALVAMALLATAASDIFTQDLEDLPEELAQAIADEGGGEAKPAPAQPKKKEPGEDQTQPELEYAQDTVAKVGKKTIKTKNGDKVVYMVHSGSGKVFETLVQEIAEKANSIVGTTTKASIGFTTNQYGSNLRSFRALGQEAES